jgi:hypothetical protein
VSYLDQFRATLYLEERVVTASVWKGGVDLNQGPLLDDPGFYLDYSSIWKMGFIWIMINIWMNLGGLFYLDKP